MKRCVWVEPVLVAQVKFAEWSGDDQLRQPVFLGFEATRSQWKSSVNKRSALTGAARFGPLRAIGLWVGRIQFR
jgi:ATP-dependent DNA ligase